MFVAHIQHSKCASCS